MNSTNNSAINSTVQNLKGLETLWAQTTGSKEICVAVLDGPVDFAHSVFQGAKLSEHSIQATSATPDGLAVQHGTAVASIIFAQHHSDIKGIAPDCRGIVIPIYSDNAEGNLCASSQLDLARAINLAADKGANIINISGGELSSSGKADHFLDQAIRRCEQKGILIVAAAGNDACACHHIPAAVSQVLAVGAMDDKGIPLPSSNWGPHYQTQGILAPGKNIPAAAPQGKIESRTGTSFATPLVTGIAALLLSIQRQKGLKPDVGAVRHALLASVLICNTDKVANCKPYLKGTLDVAQAYQQLQTPTLSILPSANQIFIGDTMLEQQPETQQASMPEPEEATSSSSIVGAAATEDAKQTEKPVEVMPASSVNEPPPATEKEQPAVVETKAALGASSQQEQPSVVETKAVLGASSQQEKQAATCLTCDQGATGLVYALGSLDYDLISEARRDSFSQDMPEDHSPDYPLHMLEYLKENPYAAESIIWTLNLELTPIYAIRPMGNYGHLAYERLAEFLQEQLAGEVQRVSAAGYLQGSVTLMSGQEVPVLVPDLRGMYSWSTEALVEAVCGEAPADDQSEEEKQNYEKKYQGVFNFLERVYHELRNLGTLSEERALNFAATNAYQVAQVFESALKEDMELDSIDVEKSPVARPDSDCWDVKMIFFNPSRRLEQSRLAYRFTVDVSDIIPVLIGPLRQWYIY
ncbi:MAG: PatA/PatG family cyanobactin maturation protease [Algicola sp.]|nr:PatA/PatG family cyanobactin maturation protease [Algicola sp.]